MNSKEPEKRKKPVQRKTSKTLCKAGSPNCCGQKSKCSSVIAISQALPRVFGLKKSLLKITVLSLIILLNWAGLSSVGQTLAYLNDEEGSTNLFQATTLDFILTSPAEFIPEQIFPGQPSFRDITVVNVGELDFDYPARAIEVSGDLDFCNALQLEVKLDNDIQYSGPLPDFISPTVTFPTSTPTWSYNLSLPPDTTVTGNEVCEFKFVYDGFQQNLMSGEGFNDTEEITNIIKAPRFCSAYSPGYWAHHDGCTNKGEGESIWTGQINILSANYSSVFASVSGEEICQSLWEPFCPKGNTLAGKICRAKRQTLADLLNVVSNNLDTNALIAGSDNGNPAFDLLGLTATSTVDQAMQVLEGTLANASSTVAQINAVTAVGDRIHTYYEEENSSSPSCNYSYDVVLNEFLPNPIGNDNAPKPNGEWVELYNRSNYYVDVAGWVIYDNNNIHDLVISNSNTDTGSTLIPPLGFLVVYRNGDSDFVLNNSGGDSVRLFNGRISHGAQLLDAYTYTSDAPPGKSFARIPDGSSNFVDPEPTPGETNSGSDDMLIIDYDNVMCGQYLTCIDEMADSPEIMTETEPEPPLPDYSLDGQVDTEEIVLDEIVVEEPLVTNEIFDETDPIAESTTTQELIDNTTSTPEISNGDGGTETPELPLPDNGQDLELDLMPTEVTETAEEEPTTEPEVTPEIIEEVVNPQEDVPIEPEPVVVDSNDPETILPTDSDPDDLAEPVETPDNSEPLSLPEDQTDDIGSTSDDPAPSIVAAEPPPVIEPPVIEAPVVETSVTS